MAESKHIHKFRRKVYDSGNKIFYCTLPDCYFKIELGLSLGKVSLCNRCGQPFEMNSYSIRLSKPHCPECHETKSNEPKTNDGNLQSIDAITKLKSALNNEASEENKNEETFKFKSLDDLVADDIL